ncbi:MAG: hypothetical protein ACI8QC_001829 [Planctomycetota bacterium]|jgi:hypothetical protein
MSAADTRALRGICWFLVGLGCAVLLLAHSRSSGGSGGHSGLTAPLGLEVGVGLQATRLVCPRWESEGRLVVAEGEAETQAGLVLGRGYGFSPVPGIEIEAIPPTDFGFQELRLFAFTKRALFRVTLAVDEVTRELDPQVCRLPTVRVLNTEGELRLDLTAVVAVEPVLIEELLVDGSTQARSCAFYYRAFAGTYELLGWKQPDRETRGLLELTYGDVVERYAFVIVKAIDVCIDWGMEGSRYVDLSVDLDFGLGESGLRVELFDMGTRSVIGPLKQRSMSTSTGAASLWCAWLYETWPPVRPRVCLDLTAADGLSFSGTYFPSAEEESSW